MSDEVAVSVCRRPWERRQLCRELATGEQSHAKLGKKYGVTRQAITAFAKRHAREVDEIKGQLDNEFAGLWIASKEQRLAAYQDDFETSANGKYRDHFDQIRTRTAILHNVAEEMGQLPNRSATVAIVPVTHIIEGIDLEALK